MYESLRLLKGELHVYQQTTFCTNWTDRFFRNNVLPLPDHVLSPVNGLRFDKIRVIVASQQIVSRFE